jgi:hypothetical protein
MENRKLISVVYLVASALAWLLARAGFNFLYSFYEVRRLPGMQYAREAVPVLVAVVLFLVLFKSSKVSTTLEEVISELKKVTWPSYPDVVSSMSPPLPDGMPSVIDFVSRHSERAKNMFFQRYLCFAQNDIIFLKNNADLYHIFCKKSREMVHKYVTSPQ